MLNQYMILNLFPLHTSKHQTLLYRFIYICESMLGTGELFYRNATGKMGYFDLMKYY